MGAATRTSRTELMRVRLCFLAAFSAAAPASAETLAQALSAAYENNPSLRGQRYEQRALDEALPQALAGLRPRLSVDATGVYQRDRLGKADRDAQRGGTAADLPDYVEGNSNNASLVVEQPLFTGGRATADIRGSEAQIRSGRETLRVVEGDVLLQVVSAYADVRRDIRALTIREQNLASLARQLEETQARQEAGELTRTDVAQAQSQLMAERALIAGARQQLQFSRRAYTAVVGHEPEGLEAPPALAGLPADIDQAFSAAEKANPELRRALFDVDAARSQVSRARAETRPTVSVRGSYGYSGSIVPYDAQDQGRRLTAQLTFSQPLYSGGLTSSLIRQALARESSTRIAVETTRRSVVQNIANAWNAAATADTAFLARTAQVEAAQLAVEGLREEFRVGQRSTLDLLIGQQTLRDAEVNLAAAERDAYVARAAVLRQIGRLEARVLLSGPDIHEPAVNTAKVVNARGLPWDSLPRALDAAALPNVRPTDLPIARRSAAVMAPGEVIRPNVAETIAGR